MSQIEPKLIFSRGVTDSEVWCAGQMNFEVRRCKLTYGDVRRCTAIYLDVSRRTSTYIDVRRRTSTYDDARQRRRTSTYVPPYRAPHLWRVVFGGEIEIVSANGDSKKQPLFMLKDSANEEAQVESTHF